MICEPAFVNQSATVHVAEWLQGQKTSSGVLVFIVPKIQYVGTIHLKILLPILKTSNKNTTHFSPSNKG